MVAKVIRDGERYYPPADPDPVGNNAFTAANNPHGARKLHFNAKSPIEDAMAELHGKEPKFFAHLWEILS